MMQNSNYYGEKWVNIPDFETLYQVSNEGRVKSVDRYVATKDNKNRLYKGRILKINGNPYGVVVLHNCDITKTINVHKLVAEMFLPNPNNYPCVNHKDENKRNNFVWINADGTVDPDKSNLEWCTYKYNTNYGTCIERRVRNRHTTINY